MERFKLIISALLVILGVIIVLQNTEQVGTRFFFYTLAMPRAVLLFGTTCIGFMLGVLVSAHIVRKKDALPHEQEEKNPQKIFKAPALINHWPIILVFFYFI